MVIKTRGIFLPWLACLGAAFAGNFVRADGIALSTDGLIWAKGVGGYGDGWGNSGTSVSVRQGGTIYIKYYTDAADAALCYADHGRDSGGWRAIGPALLGSVGTHPNEPVILRLSDIGTPRSTVAWINGPGKSGIWSGPPAPGPYDLALHSEARWTLPPIIVTEAPKSSFWSALAAWLNPPAPSVPTRATYSTPDGGATAILFALALVSMALVRRIRS